MAMTQEFGGGAAERLLGPALWRGWRMLCPVCGETSLYPKYLKVASTCSHCATELHHHRADDAPPYFTIFIVGHIVIPGALALERWLHPETWVHWMIWLPMIMMMSFLLLPRVKGALVGMQWALRMHGFDDRDDDPRTRHLDRG
jgi:uncharacterized protein (DUF983 family)